MINEKISRNPRVVFRGNRLGAGTHVGFGYVDVNLVLTDSRTPFGARVVFRGHHLDFGTLVGFDSVTAAGLLLDSRTDVGAR